MIFGDVAVDKAEGAILAHAVKLADCRLAKGSILSPNDIAALKAGGIQTVIAGRLEAGDLMEDEAASVIAGAILGEHLRFSPAATGRVNVFAEVNGLFVASRAIIDTVNRIDPAITLATLADHASVRAGDMVATIKIIPLAVAGAAVRQAVAVLREASPAFAVKPFSPRGVALVATQLPSLKLSVMDKTRKLLDQRLSISGSYIASEMRVAHRAEAVAEAIAEAKSGHQMIIVFGASAVTDDHDVIPEAIRLAGGTVQKVGLPVDPGNLLVLGALGDIPVIGAPGCARSPKENAFDWVLARIMAGEMPDNEALTGFGVGGLLMEIPTRPLPRAQAGEEATRVRIGAVILAAGQARRMGQAGHHKLLAEFDGEPLVARTVRMVAKSKADRAVLVTGHRADEIKAAVADQNVEIIDNPDYANGMASSLRAGLACLSGDVDGIMVVLADMPAVTTADFNKMIEAFHASGGRSIVRAVSDGKRGNPVILPSATFEAISRLEGDIGARPIIERSGLEALDIDIGLAAHLDVDTVEAILAAGGTLKG